MSERSESAGSLVALLRRTAESLGLHLADLRGTEPPTDEPFRLRHASVWVERGYLTADRSPDSGAIGVTLWWNGPGQAARGWIDDPVRVVELAHGWQEGRPLADLQPLHPWLEADELTLAHERGEAVAVQWQRVRALPDRGRVDREIVEAAYAQPLLRGLYPMVSHGSLHFSRCTHYPYSDDVPRLYPVGGGGWLVVTPGDEETPTQEAPTAAEAVALVVAGLPAGCGPAVEGPLP